MGAAGECGGCSGPPRALGRGVSGCSAPPPPQGYRGAAAGRGCCGGPCGKRGRERRGDTWGTAQRSVGKNKGQCTVTRGATRRAVQGNAWGKRGIKHGATHEEIHRVMPATHRKTRGSAQGHAGPAPAPRGDARGPLAEHVAAPTAPAFPFPFPSPSPPSPPPRRPPSPSPAHLPRAAPRAAPRASRRPWHRPAPRRSPPRCPSLPAPRLGPSSVRRQRGSPRLPPRPAALTAGPEVPPGGATPWGSGPGAAYRGEPPGGCGTAIVRPPRRGRAGRSAAGIYSSLWPPARRPLSCRCFSRTDPSNFEAASPSGRNEP